MHTTKQTAAAMALMAAAVLVSGCTTTVPGDPVQGATPDKKVLNQGSLEDGVHSVLVDQYHIPNVEGVVCPAHQEVKPGNAFDCAVTIDGGQRTVTVTIKDDAGTYEVGQPR